MKRYYICIVIFLVSVCGIAQNVEDSIGTIQVFDEFEKYSHLAKDSLAIQNIVENQKFRYSARHFTVEKARPHTNFLYGRFCRYYGRIKYSFANHKQIIA